MVSAQLGTHEETALLGCENIIGKRSLWMGGKNDELPYSG
jgi:hypothetical protein